MGMQETLKVCASLEELDTVIDFVEEKLSDADCPMKVCRQIMVSVEEIYVNVANYAYPDAEGYCEVMLQTQENSVTIQVSDNGKPFNPLERDDPDITLSAEEREIGGLGIYMTKTIMDEVSYEYINNQNRLTMTKSW